MRQFTDKEERDALTEAVRILRATADWAEAMDRPDKAARVRANADVLEEMADCYAVQS